MPGISPTSSFWRHFFLTGLLHWNRLWKYILREAVYIILLRRQISVYKHFSGTVYRRISVYKYFSGAGKVYINTFQASPAPERYQISTYIEILIHLSGAGEVFIYTLWEVLCKCVDMILIQLAMDGWPSTNARCCRFCAMLHHSRVWGFV